MAPCLAYTSCNHLVTTIEGIRQQTTIERVNFELAGNEERFGSSPLQPLQARPICLRLCLVQDAEIMCLDSPCYTVLEEMRTLPRLKVEVAMALACPPHFRALAVGVQGCNCASRSNMVPATNKLGALKRWNTYIPENRLDIMDEESGAGVERVQGCRLSRRLPMSQGA